MPQLPPCSVDLILADLPFGTTAHSWDSIIPLEPLWAEYKRLLKPQGAVVLHASQPFTSRLTLSNLPWFKYSLIWEKDNGRNFLAVKWQPFKVHEDILVFSPAPSSYSPNPTMTYNPQMAKGKPYRCKGNKQGLHQFHSSPAGRATDNHGTRYPRSVLRFNCERGLHPTQKPTALAEYLIRTYSNPGDTVLDNVMGSGTTGVACQTTGRQFIGIEQDRSYFDVAVTRLGAGVSINQ